jgi:DNA-directed RNA polymerase subunit RPC12/RpoP
MRANQGELFERRDPRHRPRVLMHVIDAGDDAAGRPMARFACGRCGRETVWLGIGTIAEAKRGIPCKSCNPAEGD